MWIESEVGDTLPARNSIRSLTWSAVIDVVPPDRITEPQRFCRPSLSAGPRNERAPPPPPATGVSSVASNQGISWSSAR